jgi:hypothetical protein
MTSSRWPKQWSADSGCAFTHCFHCLCRDSHIKGLYYTLRCFMMDLWDHDQGECAASSDEQLQTQLELTSLQVRG